jgi:hypothetical protein
LDTNARLAQKLHPPRQFSDGGRVIAQPIKLFYDPRRGDREIPLALEQRRLTAVVAAKAVAPGRE